LGGLFLKEGWGRGWEGKGGERREGDGREEIVFCPRKKKEKSASMT